MPWKREVEVKCSNNLKVVLLVCSGMIQSFNVQEFYGYAFSKTIKQFDFSPVFAHFKLFILSQKS